VILLRARYKCNHNHVVPYISSIYYYYYYCCCSVSLYYQGFHYVILYCSASLYGCRKGSHKWQKAQVNTLLDQST